MQTQASERLPEYLQTVLWVQHVSVGSHVAEGNATVCRSEAAISQSQFKSGRKKQNVNADTL
jgi:hypothetical protein